MQAIRAGVRLHARRQWAVSCGLQSVHASTPSRQFSDGRKPSIEMAQSMPRDYNDMSNNLLVSLAMRGDDGACKERLIREIMFVDGVNYEEAETKATHIQKENTAGSTMHQLPYRAGIAVALVAGVASFPLVFDLNTALWFNEHFVTADVAEPRDLETPLEVGAWTWNWMEPPLGQISFFLLCLQWARDQMLNINVSPYTQHYSMMESRASSLVQKFPEYNSVIVSDFAKAHMWE